MVELDRSRVGHPCRLSERRRRCVRELEERHGLARADLEEVVAEVRCTDRRHQPGAQHPVGEANRRVHVAGDERQVVDATPVGANVQRAPGPLAASRFYCALFGWTVLARHRPMDDASGWWVFRLDGKDVGDIGPGPNPTWTMNISVDDADVTARAVFDRGGGVSLWPTSYFDAGRMAICTDPLGARFAIWESAGHLSPDVMHEPGSFTWCELTCRGVDVAKQFYAAVFGWESMSPPYAEGSGYTVFLLPGIEQPVAGMVQMDELWPEDIPPHWMIYFAVADTDLTAARAAELGGTVSVEPFDLFNVGRVAVLNDPEGASFSILQGSE